jgi:hypothetical protein
MNAILTKFTLNGFYSEIEFPPIFLIFAGHEEIEVMLISRYAAVNPPVLLLNGSIVIKNDADDPADFLKSSFRQLNISYPKFFKMDNLCKLAFLSAEILLKDSDLLSKYPSEEIGMIILNSSSSLETDLKHQDSITDRENYFPSPSIFVYTLPNIMTGEIAIRHKIKGENGVFISEKPDAQMIFTVVDELFSRKRVSCCIAGWVDAFKENLTSCLFLVENEEKAKSYTEEQEITIFDASNIERIFKEVF